MKTTTPSNAQTHAPRFVRSKAELEKVLGISRSALYRGGLIAGAPKPKRDGRLDVEAWRRHLEKHKPGLVDSTADTTPPDGHRSWAEALVAEKAMRERIKRLEAQGRVVPYEFASQLLIRSSNTFFHELHRRLKFEVPPMAAGQTAEAISDILEKALAECCDHLRANFDQFIKSPMTKGTNEDTKTETENQ